MKRILSWAFGLPVAVVLIAFAIANRRPVAVSFDPLTIEQPWLAVSMPLWALLYIGIFLGLIAGGVAAWLKQGRWRRIARDARRELDTTRSENDRLKQQLSRSDLLLAGKDEKTAA